MNKGEIPTIGEWKTNAEMMLDIEKLGFLPRQILDLTYGMGNFWTPGVLEPDWTNDLHPAPGFLPRNMHDFRATGYGTGQYQSVVFDPPYKMAGTPSSGEKDRRYGTDEVHTRAEILTMLAGGVAEGARITSEFLLVKCMDQVNGGKVRWMTQAASDVARACEMRHVCEFKFKGGTQPQPSGRTQVHPRNEYSTLMVFGRR